MNPRIATAATATETFKAVVELLAALLSIIFNGQKRNAGGDAVSASAYPNSSGLKRMNSSPSGPVADVFFSPENIRIVNTSMIRTVYERSGKRISEQSQIELGIIMRSIFLSHSSNLPYMVQEQVDELNGLVVEYCAKTIISAAEFDDFYEKDREQSNRIPPANAVMTTAAGRSENAAIGRDWLAPDVA